MALVPKTAVLQVRLDPDLLRRYQAACDARNESISNCIRRFMQAEIEAYERHLAKKRLQADAAASFGRFKD
jgi:hypothetical protein